MNFRAIFPLLLSTSLLLPAGCASSAKDQMPNSGPTQTQTTEQSGAKSTPNTAASLEGVWRGKLEVSGASLTIIFNLKRAKDAPNGWQATMDSPDQGATGIPVTEVLVDNNKVQLNVPVIRGAFEGTFADGGDAIDGAWGQAGQAFPLYLQRSSAEEAYRVERPQDPKPPFPYAIEEVEFAGGQPTAGTDQPVKLAGTLTLPKTEGPHPVLVLLTGSGPQDRDETILNHKPFWVLADFLSRNGVAVLRFDDRGVAKSTGVFDNATIDDFVTDALAAVEYLGTRDDINADTIGLLGHSEGANVAPRASLLSQKIDFLVLLAPTAVPGTELLARQNALLFKGMGMSEDGARAYETRMLETLTKLVEEPLDKPVSKALRKTLRADFKAAAAAMSPQDRKVYGPTKSEDFDHVLDQMLEQLTASWMRSFLAMKPATTFTKLTIPTLAIYGSKDLQVAPAQNVGPLRDHLAKHPETTVTVLNGLNHLFQPAQTGLPAEYATIKTTLDPELMDTVLDWLQERDIVSDAPADRQ